MRQREPEREGTRERLADIMWSHTLGTVLVLPNSHSNPVRYSIMVSILEVRN